MDNHSFQVCQHIGIFVDDLEKMTDFYTRHLGFVVEKDTLADARMMQDIFGISSACRMRYLFLRGLGIELFYFTEEKLSARCNKTAGYNHWTLMVEDKVLFCEHLQSQGIKVIKVVKPHGYTFFIEDPESNLIEVKSHAQPREANLKK